MSMHQLEFGFCRNVLLGTELSYLDEEHRFLRFYVGGSIEEVGCSFRAVILNEVSLGKCTEPTLPSL
jgi:hypothetical protein